MEKSENKRYLYLGFLFIVSILAFMVRWKGIEFVSGDMVQSLIPWSESLKPGRGLRVLSAYKGNYNMPYVTIIWLLNHLPGSIVTKIKLVSIFFDYLGAAASGLLVVHFSEKRKEIRFAAAYTAVLFYPSAVLNSSYWGQCDMIYVTFLLYMILALLKGHYRSTMVLLGCAFSFKLQSILLLPILLVYWWKNRIFSAKYFLLVPIVMEILCIPAILGGCPVLIPFLTYLRQASEYPYMYMFYPNMWALFRGAPGYIFMDISVLLALAGVMVFAVAVLYRNKEIPEKKWIEFAVWSIFWMLYLLPRMHERYGMLLEILAIIYAFLNKRLWWNAVVIGACSYLTYLQTFMGKKILPDKWIALAYLLCFGFFTWEMVRNWSQETGKPKNALDRSRGVSRLEAVLMNFFDKYIIWLVFIVLTILVPVIRKPMLGSMSIDYLPNLIEVEGNYHTPLYMLLMFILGSIEKKPLFFLTKMTCMGADILAAGLMAVTVYYIGTKRDERNRTAGTDWRVSALIAYGIMLFFPGVLLNSSLWGHLDSLAIALLLSAALLYMRKKEKAAGILAGLACGFFAHYLVWLILLATVYGIAIKTEAKETASTDYLRLRRFGVTCIAVMLLSGFSGLLCGYGLGESFGKLFGFWEGLGTWMLYPLLVFVLLVGFFSDEWVLVFILLQIAVLLDWGQFLVKEIVFPDVVYRLVYLTAGVYAAVSLRKNGLAVLRENDGIW